MEIRIENILSRVIQKQVLFVDSNLISLSPFFEYVFTWNSVKTDLVKNFINFYAFDSKVIEQITGRTGIIDFDEWFLIEILLIT